MGGWGGTITCYKIESPLIVNIDGAGPEKAEIARGEGGALKWMASVSVDSPTRMIRLKADTPTDGADVLAGPLSADMTEIAARWTISSAGTSGSSASVRARAKLQLQPNSRLKPQRRSWRSLGTSVIRTTFTAIAIMALAPFAQAQTPPITGEWTGKYICAQGITALRLTIEKASAAGVVTATFNFGPLSENPEVPKGAYRMRGTYDAASRRLQLSADNWIDQPFGYAMVGLVGHMASSGEKIAGQVPDLFSCTDFEVWRPTQLVG